MSWDMGAAFQAMEGVVRSGADVEEGMQSLLALCARQVSSPVWHELEGLPYSPDASGITDWLARLLTHEPPPDTIVAYWFGLFTAAAADDGEDCTLYLAGADRFAAGDAEWACDPAYFPAGRYADSPVLRQIHRLVRVAEDEVAEVGGYVLPLGYACLAVAQACREASIPLLLGNRPQRQVAVGYDEGDYVHLGTVDQAGWHLAAPAVPAAPAGEMPAEDQLTKTMAGYAQDAIDLAHESFGVELDLSEESVAEVESILDRLYTARGKGLARLFRRGPSQAQIRRMAKLWGAYVGEVIRRRWGARWTLESTLHAEPTITLRLPWDEEIDPTLKAYRRLTRGREDDLSVYYRVLQLAWSKEDATPQDLDAYEE